MEDWDTSLRDGQPRRSDGLTGKADEFSREHVKLEVPGESIWKCPVDSGEQGWGERLEIHCTPRTGVAGVMSEGE